jgi:hypothetical protein
MPIYVKDGGDWRILDTSGDGPDQLYVRDGTSFTNKTVLNGYIKESGAWKEFYTIFQASSFETFNTAGNFTDRVPALANRVHIQSAVGGGSGGYRGADYDKVGGESAGPGGASGAFISDIVFAVTGGEQLSLVIGGGGAAGTGVYNGSSGPGGDTTLSGATTGPLFTLGGGGAASVSGGSVQGQLRTNTASTGGTRSGFASLITSGTTVDGLDITSFTSGPRGSFNQQGDGTAGANPGNCSGDNCTIGGGDGGDSFAGSSNTGGTGGPNGNVAGTAGTRGAGGGGGGTEPGSSAGGAGGAGEIVLRYLRM